MVDGRLLLRPQEAADALAVSRSRVYEMMADGRLGSVRIGASRRVPVVELMAFVEQLRAKEADTTPETPTTVAA